LHIVPLKTSPLYCLVSCHNTNLVAPFQVGYVKKKKTHALFSIWLIMEHRTSSSTKLRCASRKLNLLCC